VIVGIIDGSTAGCDFVEDYVKLGCIWEKTEEYVFLIRVVLYGE